MGAGRMWCALTGSTPMSGYRTGATRALDVVWEGPGVVCVYCIDSRGVNI